MSDFEYEFQMALTNRKLNPLVETVFLTTTAEHMYLSSSLDKSGGEPRRGYHGLCTGLYPAGYPAENWGDPEGLTSSAVCPGDVRRKGMVLQ